MCVRYIVAYICLMHTSNYNNTQYRWHEHRHYSVWLERVVCDSHLVTIENTHVSQFNVNINFSRDSYPIEYFVNYQLHFNSKTYIHSVTLITTINEYIEMKKSYTKDQNQSLIHVQLLYILCTDIVYHSYSDYVKF